MNIEQEHVSVKKNEQRRTKGRKSFQTVDMSTQYGEWKSQNRVIIELVVAELGIKSKMKTSSNRLLVWVSF